MPPVVNLNSQSQRILQAEAAAGQAGKLAAVQSTDLFKSQKSVVIEHNGASYRLQTTKLGKLILTK